MESPEIDDFHRAVRPFMVLSQLFSLFPLGGLFRATLQEIRFRWLSPVTVYSLYFFLSAVLTLTAHIYYSIHDGILGTTEISGIIYYSLNLGGAVVFFTIAIRWRTIMERWRSLEEAFLHPPYADRRFWTLKRITAVIGTTMLVLAFVEDALHVASVYYTNLQFFKRCDNSTPYWRMFYEREHPKFFHYVPYSLPAVLLLELTHKIFLYVWTFMDLFVIFVALGLARRFEQFYSHAVRYKGRHVPGTVWQQLRLDYGCISNLVAYMEGIMAPIIVCTTSSDLFFIFFQMFNAFQFSASLLSEVYFKFSLAFLIFRTLAMLTVASNVHVASLRPLDILRSVPMSCWSIDVQRFTQEILSGRNCLSGHGFFFLNRSVILAMAGTLITYELVMLKEVDSAPENADFCGGEKKLY